MPTCAPRSIRWTSLLALAGLLSACATPPETANDVLARASTAMGDARRSGAQPS